MEINSKSFPLVSVGIPTYNRPIGLKKTLECITGQTYQNLEVIVSDNCSPTNESELIIKNFMRKDSRIKYFKQSKNRGPYFNFNFVLRKATGKYFMWASDDDEWESYFIEKCVKILESSIDKYVAAIMEAQYFEGKKRFAFFPEGQPFYHFYTNKILYRLLFTVTHNYGNLFYSVFLKSDLLYERKTIFELFKIKSINEIFILLFVSQKGNWKVLPEIGLYKQAPKKTFQQAKWEMEGGFLPNSNEISHFSRYGLNYHLRAIKDMFEIAPFLELNFFQRWVLKMWCAYFIMQHFFYITIQRKPRRKRKK